MRPPLTVFRISPPVLPRITSFPLSVIDATDRMGLVTSTTLNSTYSLSPCASNDTDLRPYHLSALPSAACSLTSGPSRNIGNSGKSLGPHTVLSAPESTIKSIIFLGF